MRRKDREITDFNEIKAIVGKTLVMHLGLNDVEYPYIVPLSYGAEFSEGKIILYAHCAKEGHKLDLIRANPCACVEIENDIVPVPGGDDPCTYGTTYSSVIARGKVDILDESIEKIHGIKVLMKHQTGRDFEVNEQMADTVEILKFVSDSVTAKARKVSGI